MITLIVVSNPLMPSDGRKTTEITFGEDTLQTILADYWISTGEFDFDATAVTVTVSVNGNVWAQSLWSEVTPKDGDYIVIAPKVEGGSTLRILAQVAILAASVAVAATGVGAALSATIGVAAFTATMATSVIVGAINIAGNLLISAFLGPQQSKGNDSASYDPDGPKSLAQSGVVIPKGYGSFQWGGNIISSFVDIEGADQYINCLVCFGFGPARSITNIQINGKAIYDYQNVQYYVRYGTNDQGPMPNFNRIVNGYPQDTQCLAANPVVIPGTGDLTQIIQVDVAFPDGLFVLTNDGNYIPLSIVYLVEYCVSGTDDWQPVMQPASVTDVVTYAVDGVPNPYDTWCVVATDLPPNSGVVYYTDNGTHYPGQPWSANQTVTYTNPGGDTYTYNKLCQGEWQLTNPQLNQVWVSNWSAGYINFADCSTSPLYNRTTIYGLAPGKYDVRITKYGSNRYGWTVGPGDNDTPRVGQDIWTHSVNEISLIDLAYPNMILVGIRALATNQLNGGNINITALVQHGLRSVDEGIMPTALLGYEEDNPACVVADMFLDTLYGGGMWPGIAPVNITRFIDEWIAWANLNDTLVPDGNGGNIRLHVFNGVFDNESDLWSQSQVVTAMSRACIVPMGLDYGVSVDELVDAPVQMFTMGNMLVDSFTESWMLIDDRANQVEIQFADSTRNYKEDNPLVYMDPAQQDAGVIIKNSRVRGKGITIPAQAYHLARYKERSNQFLLRSGSFRTDTDGIACRIFNVVAIQHDVPQWGSGGRTLPGSTASLVLVDRDDIPFVAGTSYSLLVLHASVLRYTGTVSEVGSLVGALPPGLTFGGSGGTTYTSTTITLSNFDNADRVTRIVINGVDCAVTSSAASNVTIQAPPGFTPAVGQAYKLYDTDVMETASVTGIDPITGGLQLSPPLAQAPDDYGQYIYGVTGTVKWVRVMGIRRSNEQRSQIDWLDYDAGCYDIGTPIIGETSAQNTSNPGVTSLTGDEGFERISGSYVSFANLAWKNGPDTVGVGIYSFYVDSNGNASGPPQMIARVTNYATSWQTQIVVGTTQTFIVVGFDTNNSYASLTTAPRVTIEAVGIAVNLLLGSSFATGFAYWNILPRAGDTFLPSFEDDGEAVYTVVGSALTTALTMLYQVVQQSKWAVGTLLMLSAYIEDTCVSSGAPNVGTGVFAIVFQNSSGGTISTTSVAATLNGVTPTLRRFNTANVAVPSGTVNVAATFGVAGSGLSLAVGSTITISHFLLEIPLAGQTIPSDWADIDANGNILDIFTLGSSTGLRVQGSVLPSFTGSIGYSWTISSLTPYWTDLVILWPDGAYTQIQDGSIEITGLSSSSTYVISLYFDIVNGGVHAAVPTTPLGTPALLSATLDPIADAFCKQDNHVPLTPGGLSMNVPNLGSPPGGSPPGGRPPTCTVRGTKLATPEGLVSNEILKQRFDAGEPVYLTGRKGPERLIYAEWAPVDHSYWIEVDDCEAFGSSESHTLKTEAGKHTACAEIPDGTLVETTAGFRALRKYRVDAPAEVLHLTIEGPDHEYLAGSVWTHNTKYSPA